MPARDGKGPLGQGSRTGKGLGNCQSKPKTSSQSNTMQNAQSLHLGARVWETTFGRFFRHRRANQTDQK